MENSLPYQYMKWNLPKKDVYKVATVDWRITSACNNSCPYCYASETLPVVAEKHMDKILFNIVILGAKTACITGGEPLLEKRTYDIIKKLHRCGISIYLSTNGKLYMSNKEKLEPYISKLSLSLDGYDKASATINGRDADSFHAVIEILEHYKNNPRKNFSIKIGTILTKKTLSVEHHQKMFDLLKKYSFDEWEIYEFLPEGYDGIKNRADFEADTKDVDKFISEIKDILSESKKHFNMTLSRRTRRVSAYFIIRPDGKVIVPHEVGTYIDEPVIGDMTSDDIDGILHEWENINNRLNHFDTDEVRKPVRFRPPDFIKQQIVTAVDDNPLVSVADMAEQLKLDADVVNANLQDLFLSRHIKRIIPLLNIKLLGFSCNLVNLYFEKGVDIAEIAEILCNDPDVAWVLQCTDWSENQQTIFRIALFVKSSLELNEKLDRMHLLFGNSLLDKQAEVADAIYSFGQKYVLNEDTNKILSDSLSDLITFNRNGKDLNLTKQEYAFICTLKQLNIITLDTIMKAGLYRNHKEITDLIQSLIDKGLLERFYAVINPVLLGYTKNYRAFVGLKENVPREEFIEYIRKLKNVVFINFLDKWSVDIEFQTQSAYEFLEIWNRIKKKFGGLIAREKVLREEHQYKYDFLTDGIMLELSKRVI